MKKLLQNLGIGLTEWSDFLLISPQTLSSWLSRQTIVSPKYSIYFTALYNYSQSQTPENLTAVGEKRAEVEKERLESQKSPQRNNSAPHA